MIHSWVACCKLTNAEQTDHNEHMNHLTPADIITIVVAAFFATFYYIFRLIFNAIISLTVKWLIQKNSDHVIEIAKEVGKEASLVVKVIDDKIVLFIKEHIKT